MQLFILKSVQGNLYINEGDGGVVVDELYMK